MLKGSPGSMLVGCLAVFLAGLAEQLLGASASHMVTCMNERAHRGGRVGHRFPGRQLASLLLPRA
jgi:hypothetical protein